jgi:hypothetical protein
MSKKNIYEVFEEFKKASNKAERLTVLRKNDTYALRNILLGTFHKGLKFTVTEIPTWRRVDMPAGMAYSNMTAALDRVYLFTEGNPRVPAGLTEKRKTEILIQILESLEQKEADVYAGMLMKDLKVPYLTEALVGEAFPGLL